MNIKTLVAGVCAAVCGAAAAQNLANNESFESPIAFSNVQDNWNAFFNGGPAGAGLTGERVSNVVAGGSRALGLGIDGAAASDGRGYGAFVGVFQFIEGVTAGSEYEFSLLAIGESPNGGVEFRIEWIDSTGGVIGDQFGNQRQIGGELTNSFRRFEIVEVAPAGAVGASLVIAAQSFANDGTSPASVAVVLDDVEFFTTEPPTPSPGSLVIVDEFDGNALDTTVWRQPNIGVASFLGRTRLRPPSFPLEVSNGTLKLVVDTFNPFDTGTFFGSEIQTNETFRLEDGLIFETRSRLLPGTPGGVLGSLFTYFFGGGIRDEIDFEILSNDIPLANDRVLTNVFVDDDFTVGGDSAFRSVPNLDITEFNTYRIEWYPDRIEWFINGTLVRTETQSVPDGVVPQNGDDGTRVYLNAWAPSDTFGVAFNSNLQATTNPQQNQRFTYEVDRVEIRRPLPGCSVFDLMPPFGVLDDADIDAGLDVIASQTLGADFNGDGSFDVFDVLALIAAVDAGCL
ncbi:MAG: glycoside hydrolase family 16 protein [Planctomycetota bacterium]